jgi:hypothetical protein
MQTYSPELARLIQAEMVAGGYSSENDLLVAAVQTLAQRRSSVQGIERGLEDANSGRARPWREALGEARSRHNLANEP